MAVSPNDVSNLVTSEKNLNLTCFHLNIRSARNKDDELSIFLNEFAFEFDVIMLTETWYTNDFEVYRRDGYKTFFLNRSNKRGGGVAILMKNSLSCDIIPQFSFLSDHIECLTLITQNHVFAVMYRPPDSSISAFFSHIDKFLSYVNDNQLKLILGGDFNIDISKPSTMQIQLLSAISSNGHEIATTTATRVTVHTATLIDFFISNIIGSSTLSGVLCCDISDHFPIYMLVRSTLRRKSKTVFPIKTQRVTPSALDAFHCSISNCAWESVFSAETANEAYEEFMVIFKRIYQQHFKETIIKRFNKTRKPWINSDCLKMIKRKKKLFKKFLKTKSMDDLAIFKQYRNKLNNILKSEKNAFLLQQFQTEHCDGSARVWKKLNTLLNRGKTSPCVTELNMNGRCIREKELAEHFSIFLKDVVKGKPRNQNHVCSAITPNNHSIFLQPTSESEICTIYSSFKNSRARDIDNIQITPIKYVVKVIAPVLAYVYNLSLSTGQFPKCMQNSKVILLFKGGDKNDMSNYRPISILPVFSKGLEKIMYNRIEIFSRKHKLLCSSQYGFLKGKSTETALLAQKEIILKAFENKNTCVGVFIDFSKAFDRINHQTLLEKLELYGIRGLPLQLLNSYLEHRNQCVTIENYVSSFQKITTGVPQGSILGPLLFLFYINDIVTIDKNPKYIIYADDTSLFFQGKDVQLLQPVINKALQSLQIWSEANSLLINSRKTKAIIFHSKGHACPRYISLSIGDSNIEIVDTIKTLGVFFHKNMSWDTHVNYLITSVSKCVGILAKCRHFLPVRIKLIIYNALIMSHVNYCFLVWGSTTQANTNKLHLLQKKAIRNIANAEYSAHTEPLFIRFNLLPIHKLYDYFLALRYKTSIHNNQSSFTDLLQLKVNIPMYNIRNQEYWSIPFCRTEYGRQMLCYAVPHLLNKLMRQNIILEQYALRNLRQIFLS